jgi:hypothetical protein
MTWDSYQNFWTDLVPDGYIIAFPKTEGNFSPSHQEFGRDLSFLVNKLQMENTSNPSSPFYNHITGKSAVMGHSMGGGAAFLASENNTSITTMISFAAANTTPSSISAAGFVSVPSLVFSGENDCVAPPSVHQEIMYDSLAAACKAFISIKGGAHCEFAEFNFNCSFGQSTCSPQPLISGAEQKDVVSDILNLWLAYYLKEDCSAISYFMDSTIGSERITAEVSCPAHIAPVITQTGSVLQSSPAATYQWYYNGSLLPGANMQSLNVVSAGNYYVSVTYSGPCTFISDTMFFSSVGIEKSELNKVGAYPNPVSDLLTLEVSGNAGDGAHVWISDIAGAMLLQEKQISTDGSFRFRIDMSVLRAGIYFAEIISGNKRSRIKIVKQ